MTKQQELLILVGDDDNSLEEAFTAGNKYEVQSISKDQALSAIQSLSESERKRARLLVNDIENIGFLRLLKQNNLELPSVLLTTASMAKEVTDLSDEISHCVVVTKPCIGDGIVEALDDAVHRFKEAQAAAAIESLKAAEA